MSILRFILGSSLAFVACGCIIIAGDSFFTVTGKIQTNMPPESDRCTIGVFEKSEGFFRASTENFAWARDVDADFNVTFSIAPKPDWYYLVIRCEGLGCHKTKLLYLGTTEAYSTPVDLGEIPLESFAPCEPDMRFGYYVQSPKRKKKIR